MKSPVALFQRIAALAWPVLIAQLSSMTQMVSDTVLTGRYGTTDLAAVAVGSVRLQWGRRRWTGLRAGGAAVRRRKTRLRWR